VPVIGVNHGRLGFMTDIPLEDVTTTLPEMLTGHYEPNRACCSNRA
jgi:NAD+ kinase